MDVRRRRVAALLGGVAAVGCWVMLKSVAYVLLPAGVTGWSFTRDFGFVMASTALVYVCATAFLMAAMGAWEERVPGFEYAVSIGGAAVLSPTHWPTALADGLLARAVVETLWMALLVVGGPFALFHASPRVRFLCGAAVILGLVGRVAC